MNPLATYLLEYEIMQRPVACPTGSHISRSPTQVSICERASERGRFSLAGRLLMKTMEKRKLPLVMRPASMQRRAHACMSIVRQGTHIYCLNSGLSNAP